MSNIPSLLSPKSKYKYTTITPSHTDFDHIRHTLKGYTVSNDIADEIEVKTRSAEDISLILYTGKRKADSTGRSIIVTDYNIASKDTYLHGDLLNKNLTRNKMRTQFNTVANKLLEVLFEFQFAVGVGLIIPAHSMNCLEASLEEVFDPNMHTYILNNRLGHSISETTNTVKAPNTNRTVQMTEYTPARQMGQVIPINSHPKQQS